MTALEKEILALPKLQKISIMEQIWADLSQDEDSVEIPEWHRKELEKNQGFITTALRWERSCPRTVKKKSREESPRGKPSPARVSRHPNAGSLTKIASLDPLAPQIGGGDEYTRLTLWELRRSFI